MTLEDLRTNHADLVSQIEASARQGMLSQADADTARAAAVSAERTRVLELVTASVGEEAGKKLTEAAEKGLTAADLAALGVSLAPAAGASEFDQKMLGAITDAADKGVRGSAARSENEAAERKRAVSGIAAGGSR